MYVWYHRWMLTRGCSIGNWYFLRASCPSITTELQEKLIRLWFVGGYFNIFCIIVIKGGSDTSRKCLPKDSEVLRCSLNWLMRWMSVCPNLTGSDFVLEMDYEMIFFDYWLNFGLILANVEMMGKCHLNCRKAPYTTFCLWLPRVWVNTRKEFLTHANFLDNNFCAKTGGKMPFFRIWWPIEAI